MVTQGLRSPETASPRRAFARPFRVLPRRLRIAFLVGHRVVFGFASHDGLSWSAAMAFWLVLSLPPLLIAVSSIASALLGRETAQAILADQVIAQLPAEGALVRQILEQDISLASAAGVGSVVFLLFSGSRVFAALVNAINVMWRHVERAGLLRREAMRFAMLIVLGGMLVASVALQLGIGIAQDELGPLAYALIGWLMPLLLIVAGLLITYRLIPGGRATWRTALLGAVLAALLLRGAHATFVVLLGGVLDFEQGYGPLAGIALLMTWAFVASAIVLICAELVATLDRHRVTHLPLPSSKEGEPNGGRSARD